MPIDPSIVLSVQNSKPVDYMGAYGNALTLKNLIGQGRMQDMQLAQAQREQEKQMRLADLVRSSGGDIDKFQKGYLEIDPLGGMELGLKQRQAEAQLAKLGAEGRKLDLESLEKRLKVSSSIFAALGENPTDAQIMDGALYAVKMGVLPDLRGVPSDPQRRLAWYQQMRRQGMDADKILAEERAREEARRKAMEPSSETGKILRDWALSEETGGMFDRFKPPIVAPGTAGAEELPPTNANAARMDDLFAGAARRSALGPADQIMQYGPDGKPVPVPSVIQARKDIAKAGASQINVGVNAYEKALNQQDAQEVSKARATAEKADKNAVEVRTIVDVLRGYKGGQWNVIAAKFGEFLPGSEFAKASNVFQVAESIRARLAPSLREVGSGNMTEQETQWLMSSIPNLLQYEEGRELIGIVFQRTAERAAAAADIKDQLIRSGTYSVKAFRDAMKERFGEGSMLSKDEVSMVNRIRQSPPPEPGATAPIPKADFNLKSMPDPKANAGREIEASDGTRYKSDGTKWIRQPKGGASGRF